MKYKLETKVTRSLTITNLLNKQTKESKGLLSKILEYDLCKRLENFFVKKQFPKISFVFGGFEKIHELCLSNGISLLNHEKEYCVFCVNSLKKIKEDEKNKEKGGNEEEKGINYGFKKIISNIHQIQKTFADLIYDNETKDIDEIVFEKNRIIDSKTSDYIYDSNNNLFFTNRITVEGVVFVNISVLILEKDKKLIFIETNDKTDKQKLIEVVNLKDIENVYKKKGEKNMIAISIKENLDMKNYYVEFEMEDDLKKFISTLSKKIHI